MNLHPTNTTTPNIDRQQLRDIVQRRVDVQWSAFAERHPHLAAAIDRVTLIDATVSELTDDPAFQQAMAAAEADAFKLTAADRVIGVIDTWVHRLLGL